MKNVIVQIDTFPNTEDKIEITRLCILSLRELGYPIVITSHIEIPEELKNMCDYSFSDYNNILLPSTGDVNYFNYFYEGGSMHFKIDDMDPHSPACITGWTNGAEFAIENEFDFVLHVEYDFVLPPKEIEKLKKCIEISFDSAGFVMLGKEYVSTRCIFMRPEDVKRSVPLKISSPEDYFEFCRQVDAPNEIKRMAGVSTYYCLKKSGVFEDLVVLPHEKFLLPSIPGELEIGFGFFAPLVRDKKEVYLCSCGLSGQKEGECEVVEFFPSGEEKITTRMINFSSGFYSYWKIDWEPGKKIIIKWSIGGAIREEIKISDEDIYKETYGTFNLNNQI